MKKVVIIMTLFCMLITTNGCNVKKANGNKALKLTVWSTQGSDYTPQQKPNENVVEDWLVQKTGVKVENIYGNGGNQWDSKFTQLLAANNLPELIHCGAGQGPSQFSKLQKSNSLYGLTMDQIKEYAPNLFKKIPESMWKSFTFDGKVYGIPYKFPTTKSIDPTVDEKLAQFATSSYNDVMINRNGGMWVRDDILRKIYPQAKSYDEIMALLKEKNKPIGDDILDIPITSTEEYMNFMYKIRDMQIIENEKPVYAMGLTNGDIWMPLTWFGSELMGYRGHQYTSSWDEKNQKIRMPLLEPITKQAAKNINIMVRDKVIDPDSLLQTKAQLDEKVLNGQYVLVPSMWMTSPNTTNQKLQTEGKKFRYRPFFTQIKNQPEYEAYSQDFYWGESVAITNKLKDDDVKKVLQWFDLMFTDEFDEVRFWGPKEAGLYEDLADGKRAFKDEKLQKYFVDSDKSALTLQETKGLGTLTVGYFSIRFMQDSKYQPNLYNGKYEYTLNNSSGANFATDSIHTKVPKYPPCLITSPEFAQLESVNSFWSSRARWEDPYKFVFAAPTNEKFEQIWNEAETNLKKLFDVDKMLNEMTQISKPIAEEIKNNER